MSLAQKVRRRSVIERCFLIYDSTDFKNKMIDKTKICEMSQPQKDKCSLQYAEATFQLLYTCIYRAAMTGKLERYYKVEKEEGLSC